MYLALLLLLAIVTIGFLVLLDRRDRRAHTEREAERKERTQLLNRIQSPETAVAQAVAEASPLDGPLYVPFDDDEAFNEAVGA